MEHLVPLRHSFAENDIEDQLKSLFVDLFEDLIASSFDDANVLGMAHLGSPDLVRRFLAFDGLFLPNRQNDLAYNYLYRAWHSRNSGRGTEFLETVLQLIWPDEWTVEQMMQDKDYVYPFALSAKTGHEFDRDKFLTSRLKIDITATGETTASIGECIPVFRAILPARFVPKYFVSGSGDNTIKIGSIGYACACVAARGVVWPIDGRTVLKVASIGAPWALIAAHGLTGVVDGNSVIGVASIGRACASVLGYGKAIIPQ